MNKLVRRLIDTAAIVAFILLLTYLYREPLSGTFVGDMWEGILQRFSQRG